MYVSNTAITNINEVCVQVIVDIDDITMAYYFDTITTGDVETTCV